MNKIRFLVADGFISLLPCETVEVQKSCYPEEQHKITLIKNLKIEILNYHV